MARATRTAAIATIALFACVAAPPPVDGARILAVESIAGKSHWNFMRAVLRALTDGGHEVTAFTPFPDGDRENYTEVDMSARFPIKLDMDLEEIFEKFTKPTTVLPFAAVMSRTLCDVVYEDDRMKDALRDGGARFDLVITEPIASECVSHAAAALDLPLIYVIPSPMITHLESSVLGHVPNPAVVSHVLAHHGVPRTFAQRFTNAILLAYSVWTVRYGEWSQKRAEPKRYDSPATVTPSAIFLNSHHITEASRPLPPNVVQVGGVHLERPKSIQNDILEFIENSPNGVIYFTFGSVVKMSTLPDNIKKAFKEALAEVPQRILWKYEGEMEDIPKNIMIKKWFPQRDILMHPKVKLFISHGGISGVYETVDAGVPVLGFPLFYDQHRNIANLVNAGMAISMELLSTSKETFLNAVLELLNNEKYSKNAKTVSERFKDRPISPEKSIVYWTEYVIRHKGASHLKSHALNLTWYQYFLLDVISAILVVVLIILFVIYFVLKFIYKYTLMHLQDGKVKSE